MASPTGQSRTRVQLLDAAAELIAEHGWGRVTTRAVAERAGRPHGSVSYHFHGKEALLTEATLRVVEGLFPVEDLRAVSTLADLLALVETSLVAASAGQSITGRVLMEAMRESERNERLREHLAALLAAYRSAIAELLVSERRRGALRAERPAALAGLIAALGDGLLLHAFIDPQVDTRGPIRILSEVLVIDPPAHRSTDVDPRRSSPR